MLLLFAAVLGAATTTTTEPNVPTITGNPLSWPVFIGAGVAVFVAIVLGGWLVRRRASDGAGRR